MIYFFWSVLYSEYPRDVTNQKRMDCCHEKGTITRGGSQRTLPNSYPDLAQSPTQTQPICRSKALPLQPDVRIDTLVAIPSVAMWMRVWFEGRDDDDDRGEADEFEAEGVKRRREWRKVR